MAYSSFKISTGQKILDADTSYCDYRPHFDIHDHTECVSAFQIADIVLLDYGCPEPGDIVRYDPTKDAFVLAYADNNISLPDQEAPVEALGVVEEVHFDCGADGLLGSEKIGKVVFGGRIDFKQHKLTPGGVYYVLSEAQWQGAPDKLTGSTAIAWNESTGRGFRNGTLSEPNISKPIYISTGSNIAIVTNYRALSGGVQETSVIESTNIALSCTSLGWDISVANTGQTKWNGPITIEAVVDRRDGVTEPEVFQTWEGAALELEPSGLWESPANPPYNGKLTLNIKRGNNIIWSDSQTCVPKLQVTSGCSDKGVVYEVLLTNNVKMIEPLNFTITPTDGSSGLGQGTIKLPRDDDGSTMAQVWSTELATSGDIPVFGPLQFNFAVASNHWAKQSPIIKDCAKPECCEGDSWCVLGPNPSTAGSNTALLASGAFYYENEYLCSTDSSKMAISYQYLRENVQFCWPQVETESLPKHIHIYSETDTASKSGDEGEIENHLAYVVADEAIVGHTCYLTVDVGGDEQKCYEFVASTTEHINVSNMTLVSG